MLDFLSGFSSRLNTVLLALGAIVLILMMGLATANMVLGFFGQPIRGAYEATGFLGALAVCLALAPTQQVRGHIAVNIFDRFIPRKIRQALNLVSQIILACFFLLVIYRLVMLGLTLKLFGELSEGLRISYYPLIFVLAFGFGALVLTLVVQILSQGKEN
ncbi:TRAP transporter small permease [Desulfonatronovibrio hydrogenovorans]|uniref:TRAP transporter small permease n=1 Tax=Desulfonatronovibrio hydrogenovorans TaxID=53245 RepID=UPI001377FBDF|nr:TRAP transporter small permease [Desulfonatronovibrio hydrogenovorans]